MELWFKPRPGMPTPTPPDWREQVLLMAGASRCSLRPAFRQTTAPARRGNHRARRPAAATRARRLGCTRAWAWGAAGLDYPRPTATSMRPARRSKASAATARRHSSRWLTSRASQSDSSASGAGGASCIDAIRRARRESRRAVGITDGRHPLSTPGRSQRRICRSSAGVDAPRRASPAVHRRARRTARRVDRRPWHVHGRGGCRPVIDARVARPARSTCRRRRLRSSPVISRSGSTAAATAGPNWPTFVQFADPQLHRRRPALSSLFRDHAVLQRDRPVRIWGWAQSGEGVSVSVAGSSVRTRADANGRWIATLPALKAGGPHTLSVRTDSGATTTSKDILHR